MVWAGGFYTKPIGKADEFIHWLSFQGRMPNLHLLALHNTGVPNMAHAVPNVDLDHDGDKDAGDRMVGLGHYYRDIMRWHGGPAFFVFPNGQIYQGTPWPAYGVHSPSWNDIGIGVEMVADFSKGHDDPSTGAGLVMVDTAAKMFAAILKHQGMPVTDYTVKFHKEDVKTHHDCPGSRLTKGTFMSKVRMAYDNLLTPGEHSLPVPKPAIISTTKVTVAPPAKEPVGRLDRVIAGMNYYMSKGLTKVQAAGLLGNFMQESYETLKIGIDGDHGTAHGVAKWQPKRWAHCQAWSASKGMNPEELMTQFAFVLEELITTELPAGYRLSAAHTIEDAVDAGIAYERPSVPMREKRLMYAREAYGLV